MPIAFQIRRSASENHSSDLPVRGRFERLAVASALGLLLTCVTANAAGAQSFSTGQVVFAAPSAPSSWYSGCVVGSGRSNTSYQVECAGTTYWISRERIRTSAPSAYADPMRPGQIITPVITPSHPVESVAVPATSAPAAAAAAPPPAPVARRGTPSTSGAGKGAAADEMRQRIARDNADAANAVLRNGTYTCYAGGQYTFTDLIITGPHSYSVKPGGSGSYSYSRGALTFSSGPYEGAYSRMVDGHTVGISAKGNTNLGTQCGFEK